MSHAIASTRVKSFAAVLETTKGTTVYPADSDMIAVTDAALIGQVRPTTNSDERFNSRDVREQFLNAFDPGSWNAAMYIRPAGTATTEDVVGAPQGDTLLRSLMGRVLTSSGILLNAPGGIDDAVTTIPYDTLTGDLPNRGVIKIGTELIYYAGITRTDTVSGSFTNCTRGYGGTTAASHTDDDPISVWSRTYVQALARPSFTAWCRTDFVVQTLTGSTPNSATLDVSNIGGATIAMNGEGFFMRTMGAHDLSADASTGATTYTTSNADRIDTSMRVRNITNGDDNGGDGYTVTAYDETTGVVTIAEALTTDWTSGDEIEPWIRSFDPINTPIENRDTVLRVDNALYRLRNTSISFTEPATYINDEVGTTAPEDYAEGQREITMEVNVYLRPDQVEVFKASFEGVENEFEITYGSGVGNQMVVTFPRGKYSTASFGEDGDTATMTFTVTMLGRAGEDSATIRFE